MGHLVPRPDQRKFLKPPMPGGPPTLSPPAPRTPSKASFLAQQLPVQLPCFPFICLAPLTAQQLVAPLPAQNWSPRINPRHAAPRGCKGPEPSHPGIPDSPRGRDIEQGSRTRLRAMKAMGRRGQGHSLPRFLNSYGSSGCAQRSLLPLDPNRHPIFAFAQCGSQRRQLPQPTYLLV